MKWILTCLLLLTIFGCDPGTAPKEKANEMLLIGDSLFRNYDVSFELTGELYYVDSSRDKPCVDTVIREAHRFASPPTGSEFTFTSDTSWSYQMFDFRSICGNSKHYNKFVSIKRHLDRRYARFSLATEIRGGSDKSYSSTNERLLADSLRLTYISNDSACLVRELQATDTLTSEALAWESDRKSSFRYLRTIGPLTLKVKLSRKE